MNITNCTFTSSTTVPSAYTRWVTVSSSSSSTATIRAFRNHAIDWTFADHVEPPSLDPQEALASLLRSGRALKVPRGWSGDIELPDGTIIKGQGGDNFIIEDKDARVTYRGNRDRAFNRYVNASDLLERFIDFLGGLGVPQHRLLDCPVDVFVHWLITEAAAQDGEEPPADVSAPSHPKLALVRPGRHALRCRQCRRFIPARMADEGFLYCSAEHRDLFVERAAAGTPGAGDAPGGTGGEGCGWRATMG